MKPKPEKSFSDLGHRLGLHYQLLQCKPVKHEHSQWFLWDTLVDIPLFEKALLNINNVIKL